MKPDKHLNEKLSNDTLAKREEANKEIRYLLEQFADIALEQYNLRHG